MISDYELIAWIVLGIIGLISLIKISVSAEKDRYMSDDWMDRYIHGKK